MVSSVHPFSAEVFVCEGEWCVLPRNSSSFLLMRLNQDVGRMGNLTELANEEGCVEHLARFFPQARPVRIAVEVATSRGGKVNLRETAIVEYGSPEHAIFVSKLPLEFDDRLRIEAKGEGRPATARVVGVQYREGRKAVAVQFIEGPCDWVVTQP